MMTLYHGSTCKVETPLVKTGRQNLDFGPGFYLTLLKEQAERWAVITSSRKSVGAAPLLNTYTFDLDAALAAGFRRLSFDSYNKEWLDFIADSRSGKQPWQGYDMVEGGVANDRVIEAVEAYLSGYASMEKTLGLLAYTEPNHQICLLNQEMVDMYLKFQQCSHVKKGEWR